MSYIAHTHHLLRYNLMDKAMRIVSVFKCRSIATITTISLCNGNLGVPCEQNERQALLMFKQDLKDPSNKLLSWVGEGDCCNWTGVVCDNLTGHVRELHLSYLDLSNNDFGGIQIPSFLGSLKSLRYLNLSDSKFAGIIPHQLGNLSSLRSLGLPSKSYYWMKVKNLQWLSDLSSLQNLDVTNTLPSMLVELHMSGCELNQIPVGVANMTWLEVLNLRWNIIWGTIPQCAWLYTCSNLESLSLYLNLLRGEISSSIGNLTAIVNLDLSANQLEGKIPNSLGNLCQMESLKLSTNDFSGPLFDQLGNFYIYTSLLLSNSISGPIPLSLGHLPFVEEASISENHINGTLPKTTGQLKMEYRIKYRLPLALVQSKVQCEGMPLASQRKGRKAILSSKCTFTGPSYCNNQAEGNLFGYQKDQASDSHHSCKVGVATPMFFMSNILAGSENLG
ncbi:unnamed protein product [Prunus armeniaca]